MWLNHHRHCFVLLPRYFSDANNPPVVSPTITSGLVEGSIPFLCLGHLYSSTSSVFAIKLSDHESCASSLKSKDPFASTEECTYSFQPNLQHGFFLPKFID